MRPSFGFEGDRRASLCDTHKEASLLLMVSFGLYLQVNLAGAEPLLALLVFLCPLNKTFVLLLVRSKVFSSAEVFFAQFP